MTEEIKLHAAKLIICSPRIEDTLDIFIYSDERQRDRNNNRLHSYEQHQ